MVNLTIKMNFKSIKFVLATTLFIGVGVALITILSSSSNSRQTDLLQANEPNRSRDGQDLTIMGLLGQYINRRINKVEEPIVQIKRQGRVRGTVLRSREGRDYFAFYQIPYAAEPIGDLRFEDPQRPKRWLGVRDASKPGVECLQKEKYAPINITGGEEACLHLNIYTPKLPQERWRQTQNNSKFPVLFYVHGGQPFGNGTRYGAKYFMDEDVVLVTIEFRLGAFGSFTTGTNYTGNQGFKDQVYALEWVSRNIERFGGNPQNVMLFGNSAGGADVHAHLLSPMSKGLYHRAVVQSGSPILHQMNVADPIGRSRFLAQATGCRKPNSSESELANCLKEFDAKEMVKGAANLLSSGIYPDRVPVEKRQEFLRDNKIFLTDSPWTLMHQKTNDVPLMIGVLAQEMLHGEFSLLLTSENGTRYLNEEWNNFLPDFIGLKDDENHTIAKEFRAVYFGNSTISNETRLNLFNFQSDAFMVHAVRTSGLLYAQQGAPVYFYWLVKEPARSYGESIKKIFTPPYGGASHADELQYLFLYDGYPEIGLNSPWYNFSKMLVRTWVSFAQTGKPQPGTVDWPAVNLTDRGMKWMQLDDEIKMVEPFTQRMELWDKYTEQLYG